MIRERLNRLREAYRARRWVRWSVDIIVVLALLPVVALLHLLLLGMPMLCTWLKYCS